jgi:hypothetical protein
MTTQEIFESPEAEILSSLYNNVCKKDNDKIALTYLDYAEDLVQDNEVYTLLSLKVFKLEKDLKPIICSAEDKHGILSNVVRTRLNSFKLPEEDLLFELHPNEPEDIRRKIYMLSNMIAAKCRRGPANTIITNTLIASILQEFGFFVYPPIEGKIIDSFGLPYYAGMFGNIKVLVDPHMALSDTRIIVYRLGREEEPGHSFAYKNQELKKIKVVETDISSNATETISTTKVITQEKIQYEYNGAYLEVGRVNETFGVIHVNHERLLELI